MNGAKQIANDGRFAVQTKRIEGFFTLPNTNVNAQKIYVGNTAQQIAAVTVTLAIKASSTDNAQLLVTANALNHGYNTGDQVRISGASDGAYNATFTVTKVDANNFTFMLTSAPLSLAPTGTIVAAGLQTVPAANNVLPDVLNPTDLPLKYELPLGQKQQLASVLLAGATNDGVFYRIW